MLVRRVWPSRPTFDTPFSDYDQLRRQMLRLLDTAASDASGDLSPGVFPPINVTQDNDNFYLRAELPGIDANELAISAVRNRISIAGKREIDSEQERVSYHRKERPEGAFNRTVALPAEVDAEKVEASYNDGILNLVLPKAETARPRQIKVRT